MTIAPLSLLCMAASALLSIGAPIGLLVYFRKRCGGKLVPALVGAAAFAVFALGLEQLLHSLVLRPDAQGNIELMNRPVLYMLYGSLAAGAFEETARFLSFRLLKRRYGGVGTALSYGAGHGGIEAILVGGLSMINAIAMSAIVNGGNAAMLTSGENGALVAAKLQAIAAAPPTQFLLAGAERMFALAIHIALSVIVFYSVYEKRRAWLYPAAILLHALIDAPAALGQTGVLTNVWAIEGLVLVSAAALAVLAAFTHRKLKPEGTPGAPERG